MRTKILATATTTLLVLGVGVGGAGAAFAESSDILAPAVEQIILVDETTVEETQIESTDEPVVDQDGAPLLGPAAPPIDPGPPPDAGLKVFVCKYVGTPGVDEVLQTGNNPQSVSVNAIPDYQGVGSYFADAHGRSYVLSEDTRTGGGQEGVPDVSECPAAEGLVASASISSKARDCFFPTAWDFETATIVNATWGEPFVEDGLLTIIATATGAALFSGGGTTQTFTAPFEEAGGDDCALPSIDVVAAFTQLTCDPDSGAFTVGLFDPADSNADKLLWTTTAGTVPSATANTISEPGVVTVTVRVANAYLGDYTVGETSSLGTVSSILVDGVETALITWTFTFTEPDDCELGNVVVPIVNATDYCEGVGPNALRVATFTVTDVEHVTYQYRVNDEGLSDIDFEGDETVTITVSPLDVVEVFATPLGDFQLPEGWEWSYTFLASAFCPGTLPATVASAAITPADCDGNKVVVTLSDEGGVTWTLNGVVVEGNTTHQLVPGSAVHLTATLEGPTDEHQGGWTWRDPNQQTLWSYDGMSDEDCLSNLAFTGASSATEWLGAAAVTLMLVGMGVVARRRRVEA